MAFVAGDFLARPWKCRRRQRDHTPLGGVVLLRRARRDISMTVAAVEALTARSSGVAVFRSSRPQAMTQRERLEGEFHNHGGLAMATKLTPNDRMLT
jgi:hypothetical protein